MMEKHLEEISIMLAIISASLVQLAMKDMATDDKLAFLEGIAGLAEDLEDTKDC
jgi:hypothetical protein